MDDAVEICIAQLDEVLLNRVELLKEADNRSNIKDSIDEADNATKENYEWTELFENRVPLLSSSSKKNATGITPSSALRSTNRRRINSKPLDCNSRIQTHSKDSLVEITDNIKRLEDGKTRIISYIDNIESLRSHKTKESVIKSTSIVNRIKNDNVKKNKSSELSMCTHNSSRSDSTEQVSKAFNLIKSQNKISKSNKSKNHTVEQDTEASMLNNKLWDPIYLKEFCKENKLEGINIDGKTFSDITKDLSRIIENKGYIAESNEHNNILQSNVIETIDRMS